jgi:hypothetical protein
MKETSENFGKHNLALEFILEETLNKAEQSG